MEIEILKKQPWLGQLEKNHSEQSKVQFLFFNLTASEAIVFWPIWIEGSNSFTKWKMGISVI